VGSLGFVEKVKPLMLSRRETEVELTAANVWVFQEAVIGYGQETNLNCVSICNAASCLGDSQHKKRLKKRQNDRGPGRNKNTGPP